MLTRSAALGVLVLLLGCQRPCRDKTVLLTLTLDETAAQADALRVSVSVANGPLKVTSLAHTPGIKSGTVEISFPSGYPLGKSVYAAVTASRSGKDIALGEATGQPTSSCDLFEAEVSAFLPPFPLVVTPPVARPGDPIWIDGELSGEGGWVQFSGGEKAALTLTAPNRGMAKVPLSAQSGPLTVSTGGRVIGPVAFRVVSFTVGLQQFGRHWPQTDVARAPPKLTTARSKHTAERIGSFVYVLGGVAGSSTLATVERAMVNADGTLGRFSLYSRELIQPRACHASVVIGSNLYVLGGESLAESPSELSSIERAPIAADGSLGRFRPVAARLGTARACPAVAVVGSGLYVIGGQSESGSLTSIERAPIFAGSELGSFTPAEVELKTARHSLTVSMVGESLYAVGGHDGKDPLSTVERAKVGTDGRLAEFGVVAGVSTSPSRHGHTSATIGNLLFLFGGSPDPLGALELATADPEGGTLSAFSRISSTELKQNRQFHASVVVGDRVLLIGGEAVPSGGGGRDDVEFASFNASGELGPFVAVEASLPTPRADLRTVAIGDYLYFIGGSGAGGSSAAVDRARVQPGGELGAIMASGVTLSVPRSAPYLAVSGAGLYVLGGEATGGSVLERAEIKDDGRVGTFVEVGAASLKTPRRRALTLATADFWYLLSGQGSDEAALASLERSPFTAATGTPELAFQAVTPPFPGARSDAALLITGERVSIIGGIEGSTPLASVAQRVIAGSELQAPTGAAAPSMQLARSGHAVARVGDWAWVLGGVGAGAAHVLTTERSQIGPDGQLLGFGKLGTEFDLSPGRQHHAAFVLGDWLYVAGGQSPSGYLGGLSRAPLR